MVEGCEQVELPEGIWQQSELFMAQVQALREGSERQQGDPGMWVLEGVCAAPGRT